MTNLTSTRVFIPGAPAGHGSGPMWAKTQFDSLKLASSDKSIGETLDPELRTQLAKLNIVWRALLSFDAGGLLSALRARIEQIGPQVVAREEQKLSVDWVW
jgi:hypothetical protein